MGAGFEQKQRFNCLTCGKFHYRYIGSFNMCHKCLIAQDSKGWKHQIQGITVSNPYSRIILEQNTT
jgi:hypothetical protein